jgi:hypothetical protein
MLVNDPTENPEENPNEFLCYDWVTNFAIEQSLIVGSAVMVTFINILASIIF